MLLRVMDGTIRPNMMIQMMSSGQNFEVLEVGMFLPKRTKVPQLGPGEVGYICAGMKELSDTKIGGYDYQCQATHFGGLTWLPRCEARGLLRPVYHRHVQI